MDKPPACPPPTGEQKQKKRTYDGLPKPDNFIRYRQKMQALIAFAVGENIPPHVVAAETGPKRPGRVKPGQDGRGSEAVPGSRPTAIAIRARLLALVAVAVAFVAPRDHGGKSPGQGRLVQAVPAMTRPSFAAPERPQSSTLVRCVREMRAAPSILDERGRLKAPANGQYS